MGKGSGSGVKSNSSGGGGRGGGGGGGAQATREEYTPERYIHDINYLEEQRKKLDTQERELSQERKKYAGSRAKAKREKYDELGREENKVLRTKYQLLVIQSNAERAFKDDYPKEYAKWKKQQEKNR